jgi:hypothetical protein
MRKSHLGDVSADGMITVKQLRLEETDWTHLAHLAHIKIKFDFGFRYLATHVKRDTSSCDVSSYFSLQVGHASHPRPLAAAPYGHGYGAHSSGGAYGYYG